MFTPNRIVAFFTPVFTAAAALASAYAAKHGLNLPAGDVLAVEITAGTAAVGAALKWLHGYQAFERFEHEAEQALKYIESQERQNGVPAIETSRKLAQAVKDTQAAESARADAEDTVVRLSQRLQQVQAAVLSQPVPPTSITQTVASTPEQTEASL